LAATLEQVDDESVEYRGTARAEAQDLLRLTDCVGPMVPLADFDDPQKLRARYAELRATGATPGGFPGLPEMGFERLSDRNAQSVSALFRVPAEAPFFADHFPRRPVFPGSLLLSVKLQLGAVLAGEIAPPTAGHWVPGGIQDMKLRSFVPPGATLQLEARLQRLSGASAKLMLETRNAKELIATAGLLLEAEDSV
jgi:3-hydroxymyristoyl/3-hydroxydecanoyl-(acyl carrier protein) dehydratase